MKERFSFGGRVPWALGLMLSVIVVLSLTVAFGSRHAAPLFDWMGLIPEKVWQGQVWRLVTWPFIQPGPLSLIFGCLMLYWFGRDLVIEWGQRWFLRITGAVTLFAAVGTVLCALVDDDLRPAFYIGAWPVIGALVVAWGIFFPNRIVRLFFVLAIRGIWLTWLTIAVTVVFAVYRGWQGFLPELFAEGGMLVFAFRHVLMARLRRVRPTRTSERLVRAQAASREVLRNIEMHDDVDLPPETEKQIDELPPKEAYETEPLTPTVN